MTTWIGLFILLAFLWGGGPAAAQGSPGGSPGPAVLHAVGVENEYADLIGQIGGGRVVVTSIVNDPNTDPHSFEASPAVAAQIAGADLIVKNGAGYDGWVDKLIGATARGDRRVIDVRESLGLAGDVANPHLWFESRTPAVLGRAVADALSALQPAHAAEFAANLRAFDESLKPVAAAIAGFRARHPHPTAAATEPVGNYLLQALGFEILTPLTLQDAIMNGTDPAPQDVGIQNGLLDGAKVMVFAYNQQVTSGLTASFLARAKAGGVHVVGVYETMPTPGFTYQSWLLAEISALDRALSDRVSTPVLGAAR